MTRYEQAINRAENCNRAAREATDTYMIRLWTTFEHIIRSKANNLPMIDACKIVEKNFSE